MKAKELLLLNNYPSILFYGITGCGKTGLVSQAKNAYMLDFDDGMRTAAILDDKFTSLRQNIEFDRYIEEDPFKPTAWMRAKIKIDDLASQSSKGALKYKTVVIDSFTGLCRAIQLHTMMMATQDPFGKPQIQHWGTMINEIERVLTIIRSLKCVVLITAHEAYIDIDGSDRIRPLSITKNHSASKVAWLFDEVLYCKRMQAGMNKLKYIVTGHPTASIMARTRSNMTGEIDITEVGLAGVLEKTGYNFKS